MIFFNRFFVCGHIVTLFTLVLVFSELKEFFPAFGRVTEGLPLVIVNEGKPLKNVATLLPGDRKVHCFV